MRKSDRGELSQKIRLEAIRSGFDEVRFAKAVSIDGRFLNNWFSENYHAGMEWMKRTAGMRLDPREWYPDSVSIISVAVSYWSEDPERPAGTGQVSRYAAGKDYHFVIEEMLNNLFRYIQQLVPGAEGKIAVDSKPVLDKVWAAYSGIGWIGKHSNVISRKLGSYIFLGELFLNIELDYDLPAKNYCGSCTKCIDACPTSAIIEPYVVDSRKCISFRTIEHKGAFPPEWKGENLDWIFGCDICQEVCPWNRFAKPTAIESFLPLNGVRFPDLDWAQNLSDSEFSKIFRESPVKRSKFAGFKRNVENIIKSVKNN